MAISKQLTVLAVVIAAFCVAGRQYTFVNYKFDCSPCDRHVIQLTMDEGNGATVHELRFHLVSPKATLAREFGYILSMQYDH